MSSFSNTSKNAAFTATNASKNSSTWIGYIKRGVGYDYDSYLPYEGNDPLTDQEVFYDTTGAPTTYTNLTKH